MSVASVAGGRYRVERLLGEGGMASVYLARDTELGRSVAVKILAEPLAGNPEVRRRFLREGRLAARLAHPNVVAIYDAGEQDGRPYLVIEHVDGETLADRLRRGRLPVEEAVEIVLQACAGLEHAHAAGLVHRDVKPHNLLVARDGTVKVADFGIARAVDGTQLTQAGTILGTAAYLAPEQASGGEVGPAADVYALGAVLYELLAGTPPYEDSSLEELVARQATGAATPVGSLQGDVPPRLEGVVMRALARRPEYRPASAAELAAELRAATGRKPAEELERPTDVLRRPGRSRRRLLALAGLASASVAALAVVLVLAVDGRGSEDSPPAPVEPVPQAETPEQQARELAEWIRRRSG